MTTEPEYSSIAELYLLMFEREELERQIEPIKARIASIDREIAERAQKRPGKRSLDSSLAQLRDVIELDRRCREQPSRTQKEIILEFLREKLKNKGQKQSGAESLYEGYRKRLYRWRNGLTSGT